MKNESFTGQKFGRMTVVRQAVGLTQCYVECHCDCGIEKIASIHDLKRGFVKSCGCLRREMSIANGKKPKGTLVNDLSGRRFGRLLVVERNGSNKHGFAMWKCICDCGTNKLISGNHLTTGNTASCGCAYREKAVVRPPERRAWSNQYVKNRYHTDLKYALNRRMFQLIHATMRKRGGKKSMRWIELVGYSMEELYSRLNETMPAGYTWQSFMDGHLHIDHIIPLVFFNFQNVLDLDFHRAWALINLQLLPERCNLSKGGKYTTQFQPSLRF